VVSRRHLCEDVSRDGAFRQQHAVQLRQQRRPRHGWSCFCRHFSSEGPWVDAEVPHLAGGVSTSTTLARPPSMPSPARPQRVQAGGGEGRHTPPACVHAVCIHVTPDCTTHATTLHAVTALGFERRPMRRTRCINPAASHGVLIGGVHGSSQPAQFAGGIVARLRVCKRAVSASEYRCWRRRGRGCLWASKWWDPRRGVWGPGG
jgi:hypothetical protein